MLNIESSLQKLGLTENEIIIYVYLLKKGLSLGGDIHTDNQLDKSSAYEALSNLKKKELVYTIGQKRNQKFGALPADRLLEIAEVKENELKKVKEDVEGLMKQVETYAKQSYKNKNIRIVEGKDGFRTWAFDRVNAPKGSVIREISSNIVQETFMDDREEFIRFSAVEMPQQRLKNNLKVKALMNTGDIEGYQELKSIERTDPKLLKEVRLLPKSLNFTIPCSLVTYGDNTAILRKYKGEFLGVIINDKLITILVNSMFDALWLQGKQI